MLALQAAAGNRAVAALLRQPPDRRAAVADVTRRYDEDSIRILQTLATRPADGAFKLEDAEALATLQQTLHVSPTGMADEPLLDALLKVVGPTAAARSAVIHLVVNRAKLDVSGVLAVVYEPGLPEASILDGNPGGVNSIKLGDAAFASYNAMVAAVRKGLAAPARAAAPSTIAAEVLSDPVKQQEAITINSKVLNDPRSIRLLQGTAGSKVTGAWDVGLVRHIAAKQGAAGLHPSGFMGEPTLEALGGELISRGYYDAVIELIIDYYDLDRAHALNVVYDANPAHADDEGETKGVGPAMGVPGVVHVYPLAFGLPWAGLVHVIAHELGHVQQVIGGVASLNVREFLSRGIEIESRGMPTEAIESDAAIDEMIAGHHIDHPGFLQDLQAMLHYWGLMTAAEKQSNHARFIQLRSIAETRIQSEGTATQKAKLEPFVRRLERADAGVP